MLPAFEYLPFCWMIGNPLKIDWFIVSQPAPQDQQVRAVNHLQGVDLEDGAGRFGLGGMEMQLFWSAAGEQAASRLRFRHGHLFNVEFGEVDVALLAHGDRLMANAPVRLPLLGGVVEFRDLVYTGLLGGDSGWGMSASIESVELAQLSQVLDWPPLAGELQGQIPTVGYASDKVELDGQLLMDVFDGRIRVEDLTLHDPLGVAPVLESSIQLEALDLARLTETFSFGRIEGPLEEGCGCPACTELSVGYLHHLFSVNEISGLRLLSMHNLRFLLDFVGDIRDAIENDEFAEFSEKVKGEWDKHEL